jgi:hypothetical protein
VSDDGVTMVADVEAVIIKKALLKKYSLKDNERLTS